MTVSAMDRARDTGSASFGDDWSCGMEALAPGRLELLGNHVDYNGGLVLAGAIDRVVAIAADFLGPAEDIQLAAGDISGSTERFAVASCGGWTNTGNSTGPAEYAQGIVASLMDRKLPIRTGSRLSIAGDVPLGFGMSSSAGLCVALAMTLCGSELSEHDTIVIAREAEHRCGSPVGAMDQSASVAGGIILFDGRDTSYQRLQPTLGEYVFAVADSGVHHALGQSSYPRRVHESGVALDILRANHFPGLATLGELMPDEWAGRRADLVPKLGATLASRVDHVVEEVERVRQGVEAIRTSDWARFGELMIESGSSSATQYDISHPVVEELVALLLEADGVLGARMMGGGEGGPALALLHRDAVNATGAMLEREFFPLHPSHLHGDRLAVCRFGPGAKLTLNQ